MYILYIYIEISDSHILAKEQCETKDKSSHTGDILPLCSTHSGHSASSAHKTSAISPTFYNLILS